MTQRALGQVRLACAGIVLVGPWAVLALPGGELPDGRGDPAALQAAALLESWVAAVNAAEAEGTSDCPDWALTALPAGGSFDRVEAPGRAIIAYLSLPDEYLLCLTAAQCEAAIRAEIGLLRSIDGLTDVALFARPVGKVDADYRPLSAYLPPPEPIVRKAESAAVVADAGSTEPGAAVSFSEKAADDDAPRAEAGGLPSYNPGRPQGALSGKTVFLSPGHGWLYNTTYKTWMTQRGNNYNLIEDLSNGEAVLNHLARYLHNAGASVWPCRERDFNTNMVVIDNQDAAPAFSVTGSWPTSTGAGTWKGDHYQYCTVSTMETGVATYLPSIPSAGYYAIYLWTPSASNRSTDAKVRVRHTGGVSAHVLNMQGDGNTWRFLGSYHFNAGRNAASGAVEISNQGSDTGKIVVADAVRFGGGMGNYDDGGGISGKPRWEESGKYYPVFMGQPDTPTGSVDSMPRYAAWESEDWEDSIYLSWHSNGGGGSVRGTDVYVYASGQSPGVSGSFELFDGVQGSDTLAVRILDEVITDIHAGWDPAWIGRKFGAWLGEVNPNNNDEMPACLIEVAYHDNQLDAQSLADPRFRDLVSRAIYQGIVHWWYRDHDGPSTTPIAVETLLPEPPTHLAVRNTGPGALRVSWHAPPSNSGDHLLGDPATGYLVCHSTDGFGFDDGVPTISTTLEFTGLAPDSIHFFRIIAMNSGGQSFPSPIAGAMVAADGAAPILVVNGFDRLDRAMMLVERDPVSGKDLLRERLDRMNDFGYIRMFAAAVASTGNAFDSCAHQAVRDGDVPLVDYRLTIWGCGRQSEADHTFDATEQALVQAYLVGGGRLFASGTDIGWDLDARNHGAGFYHDYLRATFSADDAATYSVTPVSGSLLDSVGAFAFDNGSSIYNAKSPDVIIPRNGATAVLTYVGGNGEAAGVFYDGAFKVVTFGFPFETITSAATRTAVMQRIVERLLVPSCTQSPDLDNDNDVDQSDFALLQACYSGRGVTQSDPACICSDLDNDGDVDANDTTILRQCMSGAGISWDSSCK
ncbi:MAG TPA: N-acetylmuramoyl-L-alanine amidase [Phycisphaerae bacterium]|nr:N-acetylmuramoyl-L-alanine amidase [Phycisphaerae bacterium]HRY69829.1 N-acetylmuramoyl-L-alanine amidase [Phycisphaerae bacterium]HSA25444.1 N-acetylmuramoyl-L-alanine amidase [Phycisphaerae bacterium]